MRTAAVISSARRSSYGTVADQEYAFSSRTASPLQSSEQIICTGIPYGKTCFFQFCFHPGAFFFRSIPVLLWRKHPRSRAARSACICYAGIETFRLHAALIRSSRSSSLQADSQDNEARHLRKSLNARQVQQIRIFVSFPASSLSGSGRDL